MVRRGLSLLLLSLVMLTCVLPSTSSASGVKRKGMEIDRPAQVVTRTGNCTCDWRWYTVGFQPGTVTVTATLRTCRISLTIGHTPTCGMIVDLMKPGNVLKTAQAGCQPVKARCNIGLRLSYHVARSGPYYLLVHGQGMDDIGFSMHVFGNIYPLHCRKYC